MQRGNDMNSFLKSFGELVPVGWVPMLVTVFLVLTILAWCLPTWRGNALSSVLGFIASFGGIWVGRWIVARQPLWSVWTLRQLQREGLQTSWVDLRPHMGMMFMTLVGGGLAYVFGMVLAKIILRAWFRFTGSTLTDREERTVLSPFH